MNELTHHSPEEEDKIIEAAFADVQDWLGCESLRPLPSAAENAAENAADKTADKTAGRPADGEGARRWIALATLPFDDALVKKIVGLGAGVKVLAPEALKEKTAALAAAVAKAYES